MLASEGVLLHAIYAVQILGKVNPEGFYGSFMFVGKYYAYNSDLRNLWKMNGLVAIDGE